MARSKLSLARDSHKLRLKPSTLPWVKRFISCTCVPLSDSLCSVSSEGRVCLEICLRQCCCWHLMHALLAESGLGDLMWVCWVKALKMTDVLVGAIMRNKKWHYHAILTLGQCTWAGTDPSMYDFGTVLYGTWRKENVVSSVSFRKRVVEFTSKRDRAHFTFRCECSSLSGIRALKW